MKEYNLKKSLEVKIDNNNEIFLNKNTIGKISGLSVKIYDEGTLFKNKFLKDEISKQAKLLIEKYANQLIGSKQLSISFDEEGDLFFNSNKIGYLARGNTLFNPKIFLNNNHYLSQPKYEMILEKLDKDIKKITHSIFWKPHDFSIKENNNISSFLFSLNKNFGVLNLNDPKNHLANLSSAEKKALLKTGVFFGNALAFHKILVEKKNKKSRWALGSIYVKGKVLKQLPEKKVLKDMRDIPEALLHLIGYIKIRNFAVEIIFFENMTKEIIKRNKKYFILIIIF